MDWETWRAAVHGVAKSHTQLSNRTEVNEEPVKDPKFRGEWIGSVLCGGWMREKRPGSPLREGKDEKPTEKSIRMRCKRGF